MLSTIERFRNAFFEANGEDAAALITSGENRFYLTGFHSSAGAVLVTSKNRIS